VIIQGSTGTAERYSRWLTVSEGKSAAGWENRRWAARPGSTPLRRNRSSGLLLLIGLDETRREKEYPSDSEFAAARVFRPASMSSVVVVTNRLRPGDIAECTGTLPRRRLNGSDRGRISSQRGIEPKPYGRFLSWLISYARRRLRVEMSFHSIGKSNAYNHCRHISQQPISGTADNEGLGAGRSR
jgi:hypothetical protein